MPSSPSEMTVNRTRGRVEVFRQTQARRGAREARAIAGILTPAPHFLAVYLCVHRVSVVHRSGNFHHRDAMDTEKRRPGFTAHFAAFAASRAARKSASAQRRVDGPCRASVPPVEAVTMQLAERRRLGGSQRGESARAIFTPAFGSPFSEHLEPRERRTSVPVGRCEPPRRRRSYWIIAADAGTPCFHERFFS